jgi:hypothetical protein
MDKYNLSNRCLLLFSVLCRCSTWYNMIWVECRYMEMDTPVACIHCYCNVMAISPHPMFFLVAPWPLEIQHRNEIKERINKCIND